MPTAIPNLGNGPIATVWLASDKPRSERDPILAAATSDNQVVLVAERDLGRFLKRHLKSTLIVHDVAALHWCLMAALDARGDDAGVAILWELSRQGRIHDVQLLDQRIRAVRDGVHPLEKSLSELSSVEPVRDSMGDSVGHARDLQAIRLVYEHLVSIANGIMTRDKIETAAILRFGPLGVGLDVEAAIALKSIAELGIKVAPGSIARLNSAAEDCFRQCSEELWKEKISRDCFLWEPGSRPIVRRTKRGHPEIKENRLTDWLERISKHLTDHNGSPRLSPHDSEGRISLLPDHWANCSGCDPRLRAWSRLVAASAVQPAFKNEAVVKPSYHNVLDLQFSFSHVGFMRGLVDRPFSPRAGHRFAIVGLQDLELRCFAVTCRRHGWDSHLGQLLREGNDPVMFVAARFFARDSGQDRIGLDEAVRRLAEADKKDQDKWRKMARLLLDGIVRGFSVNEIQNSLKADLPESNCDELVVVGFCQLVRDLFWELKQFQEDHTILRLAEARGIDPDALHKAIRPPEGYETAGKRLANDLLGRYLDRRSLANLAQATYSSLGKVVYGDALTEFALWALNGPEAAESLKMLAHSAVGRFGVRAYPSQLISAEYRQLADETRIRVIFELVANAYALVGFDGSELVIELPQDQAVPATLAAITLLCNKAAASIVDDPLLSCCTCTPADNW